MTLAYRLLVAISISLFRCVTQLSVFLMIDDFSVTHIVTIPEPDLNCEGTLDWRDVPIGSTSNGSFIVENIGDSTSLLDWEIESYPEWGTWTFDPSNGQDMTPDDGQLTVVVEVIAPEEKNTEVTGEVRIVNSENSSDYCIVDVVLSTPKNKPFNYFNLNFFEWLLERFPNAFPILRHLLII
ncbi:hypothetical protein MBGDF03_00979 [Thermoplasmatales archaeon SCGC AB-540-F20]|nr:hypothetical protein MBGDF03_00979 [Thermoplasmatales archaeon SCGC AB-540-F20]